MRILSVALIFVGTVCAASSYSQTKLVIGITVDQMRYDYIYRYWNDYGDGGIKRLITNGSSYEDCHYEYAPTYTGPGHASIFTGTHPSIHGIIGNNWHSREESKTVYCTEDDSAATIGSNSDAGKMSPRRLLSTTIGDQLKLASNYRSKVIGIALKDRGAILPAGFLADGAYWYDKSNGSFVTSNFYKKALPEWVQQFNKRKLSDSLLNLTWKPIMSLSNYDESLPDDKLGEKPLGKMTKPIFPYDLKELRKTMGFELLNYTPYGNTITFEAAKAAIINEKMGADLHTDLLAVSFSTPDYTGHQFGPYSMEVQDMYIRFDRELADFLKFIDQTVGMSNTVIFLTADHGAADHPDLINPPAGFINFSDLEKGLRKALSDKIGTDPIEKIINEQIYLKKSIDEQTYKLIAEDTKRYLENQPGIASVIETARFDVCGVEESICKRIRNGYSSSRSGDLVIVIKPGYLSMGYKKGGTTHGSYYTYDTHVPLIFFGSNINKGKVYSRVGIQDIAPTISALLKISRPNGSIGSVLSEVFNIHAKQSN